MHRIPLAPAMVLLAAVLGATLAWSGAPATAADKVKSTKRMEVKKVNRTAAEWRKSLTPEQYRVLREKGTEIAFTGAYWDHHESGIYRCAGCGFELFRSQNKYDSGTGWPSFYQPWAQDRVRIHADRTLGMVREEALCSRCDGHLGHVFDDGPAPTHQRYCINSAALAFEKAKPAGK